MQGGQMESFGNALRLGELGVREMQREIFIWHLKGG